MWRQQHMPPFLPRASSSSQILYVALPAAGKLIQQLNGQTQRLLGQQSLAAYTGLQVGGGAFSNAWLQL